MRSQLAKLKCRNNSRGGVLVLVAILTVVLLGIAALSIDIGYISTTKNELQNVADAAALSAAGRLGEIYTNFGIATYDHSTDYPSLSDVAKAVAQDNKAAGLSVAVANSDITVGSWDGIAHTFTPFNPSDPNVPNAVKVVARRDSASNGPIASLFAGIMGIDDFDVAADAVAALLGPSWVAEGELKTPFALSERQFPLACTEIITFSPTTESCAAWHNFFDPINAAKMEDKLIGLIQGDTECQHCGALSNGPDWLAANFDISKTPDEEVTPEANAGEAYFEFQGGTISSLFLGGYLGLDYNGDSGTVYDNDKKPAPMLALFDYFRYRDDDGDDSVWSATIPVYKDNPDSCMNPNQELLIVGFAKIVVMSPDPPPSSNIQVHIDCNYSVVQGRGGGGTFGNLMGSVPNLVE